MILLEVLPSPEAMLMFLIFGCLIILLIVFLISFLIHFLILKKSILFEKYSGSKYSKALYFCLLGILSFIVLIIGILIWGNLFG